MSTDSLNSCDFANVPGAFVEAYGMPRPQWKVIWEQLPPESSHEQRHDFWCSAQRQWLELLRGSIPDPYRIIESNRFLILTAYRGDANWMLEFAEEVAAQVIGVLDNAQPEGRFGKLAILVFSGEARYRQYVRHYFQDGRPGESAGICLMDGDAHIALPGLVNFKYVLVHELTHVYLSHLRLPAWVHEGIAQHVDRLLITRSRMERPEFRREQHRALWRLKGVQPFWSGEIFHLGRDDRRQLAYELAERLVDLMIRSDRKLFNAFLRDANRDDAGEAASIKHFGFGMGIWMPKILGDGDWTPAPTQWPGL